jgi:hypothetical protein
MRYTPTRRTTGHGIGNRMGRRNMRIGMAVATGVVVVVALGGLAVDRRPGGTARSIAWRWRRPARTASCLPWSRAGATSSAGRAGPISIW